MEANPKLSAFSCPTSFPPVAEGPEIVTGNKMAQRSDQAIYFRKIKDPEIIPSSTFP